MSRHGQVYAGMMVGTSLDAVDAALVRFVPAAGGGESACRVATAAGALRHAERYRQIAAGASTCVEELSRLRFALAEDHRRVLEELVAQSPVARDEIAAVGVHGLTLWHAPADRGGHGWQLSVGAIVAARTGWTVVDDFRAADLARGGHGAPLAPLADFALRRSSTETRVVLNLGGIANATILPARVEDVAEVRAADLGPANLPLDELCRRRRGLAFDRDGALAAAGTVDPSALARLLGQADDWLSTDGPCSLGREQFGPSWVDAVEAEAGALSFEDLLATLVAFEAECIGRSLRPRLEGLPQPIRIFLTGGGRHHRTLVERIRERLSPWPVEGIEVLGEDPDTKEAVDFAWLARARMEGVVHDTRAWTGARSPGGLGCIHFA